MYRKTIYDKYSQLTLAIDAEPAGKNTYKITNFYVSIDGREFKERGQFLKQNPCYYIVSRALGVENKLKCNNKVMKPVEYGTLTCYELGKHCILPVSLIESAIDEM